MAAKRTKSVKAANRRIDRRLATAGGDVRSRLHSGRSSACRMPCLIKCRNDGRSNGCGAQGRAGHPAGGPAGDVAILGTCPGSDKGTKRPTGRAYFHMGNRLRGGALQQPRTARGGALIRHSLKSNAQALMSLVLHGWQLAGSWPCTTSPRAEGAVRPKMPVHGRMRPQEDASPSFAGRTKVAAHAKDTLARLPFDWTVGPVPLGSSKQPDETRITIRLPSWSAGPGAQNLGWAGAGRAPPAASSSHVPPGRTAGSWLGPALDGATVGHLRNVKGVAYASGTRGCSGKLLGHRGRQPPANCQWSSLRRGRGHIGTRCPSGFHRSGEQWSQGVPG